MLSFLCDVDMKTWFRRLVFVRVYLNQHDVWSLVYLVALCMEFLSYLGSFCNLIAIFLNFTKSVKRDQVYAAQIIALPVKRK